MAFSGQAAHTNTERPEQFAIRQIENTGEFDLTAAANPQSGGTV
jgi:hypothetical protein